MIIYILYKAIFSCKSISTCKPPHYYPLTIYIISTINHVILLTSNLLFKSYIHIIFTQFYFKFFAILAATREVSCSYINLRKNVEETIARSLPAASPLLPRQVPRTCLFAVYHTFAARQVSRPLANKI